MKQKGFTLIEMMITMGIIAVLASVATTSYMQYVLRANRADAKIALMQLSQRQERFFTENLRYAADYNELLGAGFADSEPTNLWVDDSNGGYDNKDDFDDAPSIPDYRITLTRPGGAATFTLTATALSTRQLKDEKCRTFTINQTGNQTAIATPDAPYLSRDETQECWGR